jgi:parallel beta-helix repeat protein
VDNNGSTDGTDCEAVIEAAITAAAGGHIHICGGDYSIEDEIDIGQNNTWISGDGVDTKLTQATADKHGFKITTKASVILSDMYLYGTGADTGSGIYGTTSCTYLTLYRMRSDNWGYHGLHVISSNYPRIYDSQFVLNIRNGILLDTVDSGQIRGNIITTNQRQRCHI